VFNVNSYLQSIAFDILSGNWDGPLYNKNNFFLYHNPATGLFEYMPYDLDNTFGIDWFGVDWATRDIYTWAHPTEPRPLYTKIMQVQEYKDRLSFYLNDFVNEKYKESILFAQIDELKNTLAPFVEEDIYYSLDYGFDIEDFEKGFSQALPYNHTPVGIKSFIATRRSATIQQLDVNDISPIITESNTNTPDVNEEIVITARITDNHGIQHVTLDVERTSGQNEIITMYDDGLHNDDQPSDGLYGAHIAAATACESLQYFISATDITGNESRLPHCGRKELIVCNSPLTLAVNEFMASNESTIMDDHGEYEDWVEIYNYGTEAVSLNGLYMSDKPDDPTKWGFPDMLIQSGEYILFWADEDTDQGPLHADIKLSAGGEFIGIYDVDSTGNALIDGYTFGEQQDDITYGRYPNGTGPFVQMMPTPGTMNESSVSTENGISNHTLSVYPNPFSDFLYLQWDEAFVLTQEIAIVDVYGRVVLKGNVINNSTVDVQSLVPGIYTICVKENSRTNVVTRVIKL
jgi:hypothetical protein